MCFEELLVLHASPTLANLKPASLISMNDAVHGSECLIELEKRGLSFFSLSNSKGQSLLLVYERLEFLRRRFRSTRCPHEVGLFLGYPPEDVEGFIENKGQGALYSGLWKVYSNKENAERILQRWAKCRRKYMECFLSGTDIARLCVTA